MLVVTDGHDLDEARDVLETVLATDRADVPATTQRRELAKQDRQPALPPRCTIPDWFDRLPNAAEIEFADAVDALERSEAKRAELQHAITVAEERLAAARRECVPFDSIVEVVDHGVIQAHQTQRRREKSGFRHRRARHAELNLASEQLEIARQQLDKANEQARPTNTERAVAQRHLSAARNELGSFDLIDRLGVPPRTSPGGRATTRCTRRMGGMGERIVDQSSARRWRHRHAPPRP